MRRCGRARAQRVHHLGCRSSSLHVGSRRHGGCPEASATRASRCRGARSPDWARRLECQQAGRPSGEMGRCSRVRRVLIRATGWGSGRGTGAESEFECLLYPQDALPAVAAPRPVCGRCRQLLALVVQVYCPLEGSPFHRLLHVFTCPRPRCGSCGARRLVRKPQSWPRDFIRSGREREPAPGALGWGWPAGWRSRVEPWRPFVFILKLEGVPLPVPADARERGARHSGKAVVTNMICCKLRVFSRLSFKLCSFKYVGMVFALFLNRKMLFP